MANILLGTVADDYTGATDLANTLVRRGMRVIQTIGVPRDDLPLDDVDAVVVALKTRTAPVDVAVTQAREAASWLRGLGARQCVWKYCSTFDSTPDGNIGPVADALRDVLGARLTIVCPAFPTTGRTIYQGHLFVGDQLLSDSPMRDHPLTPMRDSNLVALMQAQSAGRVGRVTRATVAQGAESVAAAFDSLADDGFVYAVTDAIDDGDLEVLGEAAADHALVTGGSGIALGLAENFRRAGLLGPATTAGLPRVAGREAVLAGSCSTATRAQIAAVEGLWPTFKLDPDRLAAGEPVAQAALDWFDAQSPATPTLVYASADPAEVAAVQARHGRERAGELVEQAMGRVATGLVERGVRRLVIAGGETSGAVVSALGVDAIRIHAEIDPGVPWTESVGDRPVALALKSGNFGAEDFFSKALEMLR